MFEKIDDYLIDLVQRLYTYVWNHWGITRGRAEINLLLLVITEAALEAFLFQRMSYWVVAILILILVFVMKPSFKTDRLQIEGNYKKINLTAEYERSRIYVIRAFGLIFYPYFIVKNALTEPFLFALLTTISSVGACLYFYLLCVMVTDRELPQGRFATQGI